MIEKEVKKEYVCNLCNKHYKDNSGLWYHNKKFHQNSVVNVVPNVVNGGHSDSPQNISQCKFCNRVLSDRFSRWKHEKKCSKNNNIDNELDKIKSDVEELKKISGKTNSTVNNINKGIINKGVINITMNKPGYESLEILSDNEIEYIFNQEMNSIISLIEFLNFNQKHPENHTFCTTALNDKYVSTLNTQTLEVEKQRKKDFYDYLIDRGITNMKSLLDRLKIMKTKKAIDCQNKLNKLVEFVVVNKKGKKTCFELINALSFNKRHMTQNTWQGLKDGNIINDEKLQVTDNKDPIETLKQLSKPKSSKLILKHENMSESESEIMVTSDSDTDSDDEFIYPKINFKGNTYILDGNQLYSIDSDGNKDELFGTYLNWKVKKINHFDV